MVCPANQRNVVFDCSALECCQFGFLSFAFSISTDVKIWRKRRRRREEKPVKSGEEKCFLYFDC